MLVQFVRNMTLLIYAQLNTRQNAKVKERPKDYRTPRNSRYYIKTTIGYDEKNVVKKWYANNRGHNDDRNKIEITKK